MICVLAAIFSFQGVQPGDRLEQEAVEKSSNNTIVFILLSIEWSIGICFKQGLTFRHQRSPQVALMTFAVEWKVKKQSSIYLALHSIPNTGRTALGKRPEISNVILPGVRSSGAEYHGHQQ